MAKTRFYYGAPIGEFLDTDTHTIYGIISSQSPHSDNPETKASWLSEIKVMKTALADYRGRGCVYMEYNLPRMGRRADVIVVIEGLVFVLEFKTSVSKFTTDARRQALDYAVDLKNFQEGSLNLPIVPAVVAPDERDLKCHINTSHDEFDVYYPSEVNAKFVHTLFNTIIDREDHNLCPNFDCNRWALSGYSPTPTIIEAAIALFSNQSVDDITRHDGNIDQTALRIDEIVKECKVKKRKAICFVTGVPGAGKTLIGLQTAIQQFKEGNKGVYLSGNFPLVEVLQEALTRDYVKRSKEKENHPVTKKEARSKVKSFIQMIHHYRDTYLEGIKVENGQLLPIPEYFRSHTDKAYVPAEKIAIFDEAQRAWTKEELSRFMKEKKGMPNFPYSEPSYLISCMDRQEDWGVVVCLIGGGQEINKGEAGTSEWINAINQFFPHWHVYLSENIKEVKDAGRDLKSVFNLPECQIHNEPYLHLSMTLRSFRADKLSLFVQQLLELKKGEAMETLRELSNYPIVLTRDLETAKRWLKTKARNGMGSDRFGLLASSKAERLKAININVRYQPDFVHWFLEDSSDIRSSNSLEDTLTEFKVQGLEVDWACVAWDADLRLNSQQTKWSHHQLRSGTQWQNINKPINQQYQINAYRVLLTRARQGMVLLVPRGDNGNPPDPTRKPEWYDGIYNYLKEIGLPEIS